MIFRKKVPFSNYDHPNIKRMKRIYRSSRDLVEISIEKTRSRGYSNEILQDIFKDTLSKLEQAANEISTIKDDVKSIPEQERENYRSYVQRHLNVMYEWHLNASNYFALIIN